MLAPLGSIIRSLVVSLASQQTGSLIYKLTALWKTHAGTQIHTQTNNTSALSWSLIYSYYSSKNTYRDTDFPIHKDMYEYTYTIHVWITLAKIYTRIHNLYMYYPHNTLLSFYITWWWQHWGTCTADCHFHPALCTADCLLNFAFAL